MFGERIAFSNHALRVDSNPRNFIKDIFKVGGEMSVNWNLWHGCTKKSEGCMHCYVYRMDARFERDASVVTRTQALNEPIKKNRKGEYKHKSGQVVYTCFTSDFLLEQADEWRKDAWEIIRQRPDLNFFFITKRIERFEQCKPEDWGEGWDNVVVGVTCENQKRADERLPIFKALPIKHRMIICEPLLENIDLEKYLDDTIGQVIVGGESGEEARPCDFDWVQNIQQQCKRKNVTFHFKQTGARFKKDGKLYRIYRKDQFSQARKAGLDFRSKRKVRCKAECV